MLTVYHKKTLSSPLIEEPAASLPSSSLLLLALLRLQTGKCRYRRLRFIAAASASTAQRLGDAAEGVVGEVGLRGGTAGAAEAARGALFGGLEAFFDGEELGFESGGERVSEKIPWSMRWCLSGRTYLWLATMSFS